MIGDKSKDVIILTPKDPILSLCHIYDWMGSELVQDKDSDVKYTVLLNKKMQLPVHSPEEGEEQEVIKTREIVDSNCLPFQQQMALLLRSNQFYANNTFLFI